MFCQRLQMMENRVLQKAEVHAFFSRFSEAEELLVRSERKDLAIQLMTKIGDYENVMGLIMEGAGSDTLLNSTHNQLAIHFQDELEWEKSAHFFT